MKTVLHVMNYGASYRGNFMDSLKSLDGKLCELGMKNIYLFCADAKHNDARKWIDEMCVQGDTVEFLTGELIKDVKLIQELLDKYQVEIVHTHFTTRQQHLAVYFATMFKKVKIFTHFHNHSIEAKNMIKRVIRRVLYRRCYIVACSESVYLSAVRDFPKTSKCFIDNGVNFDRLDKYSVISAEEYGVPPEERAFLIFGFDFYRKGVDLAVLALQQLREEGHNFTLLVSLSTNFEEVCTNIENILGCMPDWIKIIKARNDVATLYNYVDLFLSPSREEGLPYSVVEAAYSKCSVVLSDISAQAKLKIKYGYWFPDGDVTAMTKAILQAEKEHDEKIQHWDEVKNYMREQYALEAWSNKIVDLYRKVMNNGKV